MLLAWIGIALVLMAGLALVPFDRLPPWVTVYIGVAVAAAVVVVAVGVLT